jgi:hypothetical protein
MPIDVVATGHGTLDASGTKNAYLEPDEGEGNAI